MFNIEIWLNSVYIKTKKNKKLTAMIFALFSIISLISQKLININCLKVEKLIQYFTYYG